MENMDYFLLLQHAEEPIQENFETDRNSLGSIQHKTANIKDHIGLDNFDLADWVYVWDPELT